MRHLSYHRTTLLLLIAILFTCISTFAGNKSNVKAISNFVKEQHNIAWTMPKGFDATAHDALFVGINFDYEAKGAKQIAHPVVYPYWIECSSKDSCGVLFFPMQKMISESASSMRQEDRIINVDINDCRRELRTAVTKDERTKVSAAFVDSICQKHLIKYGGTQAQTDYNVDSVYIVDFPYPVQKPYKAIYTHCIGIYLMKKGYSPTYIKCFLTDKGYARKELYTSTMKNCIRYDDGAWMYDKAKER